jgi:hypothetical protein
MRIRAAALCLLTCAATLAATAQVAVASVANPVGGMFSITPARRYVVARPPVSLAATSVANSTDAALKVRAVPVLLTQTLSGAFGFGLAPAEVQVARRVLSVEPSRFELAPGTSREVHLRWRGLPHGARAADLGVIYQAVPAKRGHGVQVVEQLLGVDLLRRPGRYRVGGSLTGVKVSQASRGVLRFGVGVRNTGEIFTSPRRLALSIYDEAGRRVLSRTLRPDVVLPGATREFLLELRRALPAGRYRVRARMSFGRRHDLTASTSFRLISGNELPAPSLEVGPLSAQGSVGGHALVDAAVRNSGTAAGGTSIALHLYKLRDGVPADSPLASSRLAVQRLAPHRGQRLHGSLGRLSTGTYRLVATYRGPGGTQQQLVADFEARAGLGAIGELSRFSREHALLIPGVLLVLCGAMAAALLLRERRLKRALASARGEIAELGR